MLLQQEDHSQAGPATASNEAGSAFTQQANYAELAANLQSIMSQHMQEPQTNFSGGNPFGALFPGIGPWRPFHICQCDSNLKASVRLSCFTQQITSRSSVDVIDMGQYIQHPHRGITPPHPHPHKHPPPLACTHARSLEILLECRGYVLKVRLERPKIVIASHHYLGCRCQPAAGHRHAPSGHRHTPSGHRRSPSGHRPSHVACTGRAVG